MAYIANTYIKDKKKLKKELKSIYGIGFGKIKLLTHVFNTHEKSFIALSSSSKLKIKSFIINTIKTGPLLKKHNKSSLDLLKSIKCYKGQRHILHLPLRGQRTSTNNKTQKSMSKKR
jgi:small subunit ribosomal protein S13